MSFDQGMSKRGRGRGKNSGRSRRRVQKTTNDSPIDPKRAREDVRVVTKELPLALTTAQNTVVVDVPLNAATLYGPIIAYLSYASSRGYLGLTNNSNDPYNASLYMFNILVAFVNGSVPAVQSLPYWLLCLGRALAPKSAPFQLGKVSYKWLLDNPNFLPNSSFTIGYSPYGSIWNVNSPALSATNLFPNSQPAGVGSMDEQQTAFQGLCQFMQNQSATALSAESKMVPMSTSTPFDSDVSAFAVVVQQEGLGINGVGGISYLNQLEVPIFSPVLAKFHLNANASDPNRHFNRSLMNGGDAIFLGGIMSTILPSKKWRMKRAPRFHPVDFNEFGDVLGKWVSGIQSAMIADQGPFVDLTTTPVVCPLTLQETLLLLRNVMMNAFKETQSAVQCVYPNAPQSGSDNQFAPFVSSITTCPLIAIDMLLPIPLIENIRALVGRFPSINGENDVQPYVPILGQYAQDLLLPEDYNYLVAANGTGPLPSFASPLTVGIVKRQTDVKGKLVETALVEVPISLIDGNAGGVPVFINDPARLKTLVTLWNGWVTGSGVQSFSVAVGQMGTELGIRTLASIGMTRHWVPETLTQVQAALAVVDTRLKERRRGLLSTYSTKVVIADTSQGVFLAAPYEQVLQTWILPGNRVTANGSSDNTTVQRWQELNGEPYLVALTSGNTGTSLEDMHNAYAEKMVKAKLSEAGDWSQFFVTEAAQGRGGILSGIGGFLDSLIGL